MDKEPETTDPQVGAWVSPMGVRHGIGCILDPELGVDTDTIRALYGPRDAGMTLYDIGREEVEMRKALAAFDRRTARPLEPMIAGV
jgi:hypothetical protein